MICQSIPNESHLVLILASLFDCQTCVQSAEEMKTIVPFERRKKLIFTHFIIHLGYPVRSMSVRWCCSARPCAARTCAGVPGIARRETPRTYKLFVPTLSTSILHLPLFPFFPFSLFVPSFSFLLPALFDCHTFSRSYGGALQWLWHCCRAQHCNKLIIKMTRIRYKKVQIAAVRSKGAALLSPKVQLHRRVCLRDTPSPPRRAHAHARTV